MTKLSRKISYTINRFMCGGGSRKEAEVLRNGGSDDDLDESFIISHEIWNKGLTLFAGLFIVLFTICLSICISSLYLKQFDEQLYIASLVLTILFALSSMVTICAIGIRLKRVWDTMMFQEEQISLQSLRNEELENQARIQKVFENLRKEMSQEVQCDSSESRKEAKPED